MLKFIPPPFESLSRSNSQYLAQCFPGMCEDFFNLKVRNDVLRQELRYCSPPAGLEFQILALHIDTHGDCVFARTADKLENGIMLARTPT